MEEQDIATHLLDAVVKVFSDPAFDVLCSETREHVYVVLEKVAECACATTVEA